MLQNGGYRGSAAAQGPGGLVGFVGWVVDGGDGGQTERGSCHPRDVIEAAGLLVASSYKTQRCSGWTMVRIHTLEKDE